MSCSSAPLSERSRPKNDLSLSVPTLRSAAARNQGGLNVIETWKGTNSLILCGKGGKIATNDLENQELTMLALHLLQICLVYINTLMIQRVLTEPDSTQRMLPEDLRELTPLILVIPTLALSVQTIEDLAPAFSC
jgi:hypothetical protein